MIQIKESEKCKERPIIRIPRGMFTINRTRKGRIDIGYQIIDPI